MDKKDKLQKSLEKNLPGIKKSEVIIADKEKKDIKDDYELARSTYKDLINTGMRSLDVLAELARESEHPRAFEVLSRAIKDVADTTDKLMELQKNKKALNKEEVEE
jgi:DNA polymerase III epsilon subunit-like protein